MTSYGGGVYWIYYMIYGVEFPIRFNVDVLLKTSLQKVVRGLLLSAFVVLPGSLSRRR
ncbi:MAG: hypothetical protein O3A51_10665 [Verrucomicrobia bacterium]|nr:hypothetical protein [Verrucomicrobiota bacterium]